MFDDFYGLTGKPFQLTPDPEFYFRSITHRKALSYLGYGLAQGEGFIVITGEVGAGKSTLVAHLTANVDPNELTVGQIVTSKLDGEEIVHVVARSFGLAIAGHDKASALGAIEGFLHDEARAGRRCLLVVDEAQNLSVGALEELRMISNFQLGNHPLLQTLLLGQPEFRATLQSHAGIEQLRQRVIAAHHLEPMERREIEPYILHRLKKVGWTGDPAFEQEVFGELFEASVGIPRRVNQIANRLLLLGAVEERDRIDAEMLRAVLEELDDESRGSVVEPAPEPDGDVAELGGSGEMPADGELVGSELVVSETTSGIDQEVLDTLLAERDIQIGELQQAIIELSNQLDASVSEAMSPQIAAVHERAAKLEARMCEQERTIRHTLTMLIEWIEGEMEDSRAA